MIQKAMPALLTVSGCIWGNVFVFPHNDIANCEKQLERATRLTEESGGSILVITEGVFGMSGDMGRLKDIVALKKKFNFRFL
jgi:glycine C-acetyltransferase